MPAARVGSSATTATTATTAAAPTPGAATAATPTATTTTTAGLRALSQLGSERALCGRREGDEAGQLLRREGGGTERVECEFGPRVDPQLLGTHDMPLIDANRPRKI